MSNSLNLRVRLAALVTLAAVTFTGCELTLPFQKQDQAEPQPVQPEQPAQPEANQLPAPPPEPDLTASDYVTRAIGQLQVGENERARSDLKKALELRPRNRMANTLIRQFDVDPQAVLGSEHFNYTVRYGESLSLIAERYLGDPLEFYILARYNGIDNPSRLDVNQTIRVPGTAPAPPPADKMAEAIEPTVVPAPKTLEQPDTAPEADIEDTDMEQEDITESPGSPSVDYPVARLLYLNGDYAGAIRILENANVDEASRELLVKSYTAYAREFETQERLPEARSVMASASALEPTNQEITTQLAAIDDRIEANLLVDEGLAQMQANDLTGAYKSFNEALVYEPKHPEATRQLTSVKQGLIEGYLEDAEAAFEQEHIDQAIDFWDKVLELDPDNESASTSRSTALKAKHAAEIE